MTTTTFDHVKPKAGLIYTVLPNTSCIACMDRSMEALRVCSLMIGPCK